MLGIWNNSITTCTALADTYICAIRAIFFGVVSIEQLVEVTDSAVLGGVVEVVSPIPAVGQKYFSAFSGIIDINYIYMERYNKSTMPVNAEKYFMTHLGFELTTSATPPSTALSVTFTNYAIEITPRKIVRIALV